MGTASVNMALRESVSFPDPLPPRAESSPCRPLLGTHTWNSQPHTGGESACLLPRSRGSAEAGEPPAPQGSSHCSQPAQVMWCGDPACRGVTRVPGGRWSRRQSCGEKGEWLSHRCQQRAPNPLRNTRVPTAHLLPPEELPSGAAPGSWSHRTNLPERNPSAPAAGSSPALETQKYSLGPSQGPRHRHPAPSPSSAPGPPSPPAAVHPELGLRTRCLCLSSSPSGPPATRPLSSHAASPAPRELPRRVRKRKRGSLAPMVATALLRWTAEAPEPTGLSLLACLLQPILSTGVGCRRGVWRGKVGNWIFQFS